jgi:hypothetical protein
MLYNLLILDALPINRCTHENRLMNRKTSMISDTSSRQIRSEDNDDFEEL